VLPSTANTNSYSLADSDAVSKPYNLDIRWYQGEIVNWATPVQVVGGVGSGVHWDELPPPGGAVNKTTWAMPAVTRSAAGTVAVRCTAGSSGSVFAGTNVVTRGVVTSFPFTCVTHCTTVHGRIGVPSDEVPSTLSVRVCEPAGAEVGNTEVRTGLRRLVIGVVMVKFTEFDVPEAVDTETCAVPGKAASWGKIDAVS